MQLPSADVSAGESRRFLAAMAAAVVFHGVFFAAWSFLPFARAEPLTAEPATEAAPLEVQFVAPPPPAPEPEPEPEPEPVPEVEAMPSPPAPEPAPTPPPAAENVLTAIDELDPEKAKVEETPAPVEPVPPPKPKPVPTKPVVKPVSKPKPKPAPKPAAKSAPRRTAIVSKAARAPSSSSAAPPTAPSYRSNPKPAYPAEAKRAGIEGITYLRVEVLASGDAGVVSILKSSGSPLLDNSAAATVKSRWRFRPATRGGRPVATTVTVPIRFTLR